MTRDEPTGAPDTPGGDLELHAGPTGFPGGADAAGTPIASTGSGRDPFVPPPQHPRGPAIGLAAGAHALLILALAFGVDWHDDTPTAVSAELWSATPQAAAPRQVEPPPTAPPPPPPPPAPAPRAVTRPAPAPPPPAPAPAPTPVLPDPQIAIEKARKEDARREAAADAERQAKLRREKADREAEAREEQQQKQLTQRRQQELAAQQSKAAEQKRADQAKQQQQQEQREKADRAAEAQRLAQAKTQAQAQAKAQADKAEKAEAARTAAARDANLKRIAGMAGATGGPTSTGSAKSDSGPSAGYGGRVAARVKPNIVFTDEVEGNPTAVVQVRLGPDGTIIGRKLIQSSGVRSWDEAVLRAVDRTEQLPLDNGRAPPQFEIGFRPKG